MLALLLKRAGIPCRIFLPEARFSEDGRFYFEECRAAGIGFEVCGGAPDFTGYAEIADCLLGTGFRGEVRGEAAKVICRINQSSAAVISADINSGLSGDGFSSGLCVASALTVSVGYYKTGHFLGAADEKDWSPEELRDRDWPLRRGLSSVCRWGVGRVFRAFW